MNLCTKDGSDLSNLEGHERLRGVCISLMMKGPVLRYPPSPTGHLHIGTVRTCLYNFLYSQGEGGKIIYRSEDTDTTRSEERYEQEISQGLRDLGITWDEGPISQRSRKSYHQEVVSELLEKGLAYRCFATEEERNAEREAQKKAGLPPRYDGCGRKSPEEEQRLMEEGVPFVIRLEIPLKRGAIEWEDAVRGKIQIEAKTLDDFVIQKSNGDPLYNLAVVADDHDMGVTHVLRGEDHISNTPKQILIYEAMGWEVPKFGHFPLILNADKSKLSKRKNEVTVDGYLREGILPQALLNYLALLGWNTADEREIYALEELVEHFSLDRVQKGGAIWDQQRLLWINSVHLRNMETKELMEALEPFLDEKEKSYLEGLGHEKVLSLMDMIKPRARTLLELKGLIRPYTLSDEDWVIDPEVLPHKKMKITQEMALEALRLSEILLEEVPEESFTSATLEPRMLQGVQEKGWKNGTLLWPLRAALTNSPVSPGVYDVVEHLGKGRTLTRIKKVLKHIDE